MSRQLCIQRVEALHPLVSGKGHGFGEKHRSGQSKIKLRADARFRTDRADRLTRESTSSDSLVEARAHAAEAEAHAEDGYAHAAQAHDRASGRYIEAAELHERAADLLDEHGRSERAQAHREAAEQDRDAAGDEEQAAEDDWRAAGGRTRTRRLNWKNG